MIYFLWLIIVLFLILIVLEDLKERTLDIRIGFLLLILTLGYYFIAKGFEIQLLYNVAILIFMMGLLSAYFIYRDGRFHNSLANRFGMGDFIFLFAVSPLFDMKNFLLFIITGMMVALFFHYILGYFRKNPRPDIPLAGYLSLYLIITIMLVLFFDLGIINFVQ